MVNNYIQLLRESKKYSQEEVARMLDISLRHYQKIEYRISKPNVYLGLKLCKILDTNPYDVFPVN